MALLYNTSQKLYNGERSNNLLQCSNLRLSVMNIVVVVVNGVF